MAIEKIKEIKKRRQKRKRLAKLKAQFLAAKDKKEKERLFEKIKRRQPFFEYTLEK